MASDALDRRDVLRNTIHVHGRVGSVRALGREAAHPETVAGVPLVDVVGQDPRHPAKDIRNVATDIGVGDVFLTDVLHGGGQGPAG